MSNFGSSLQGKTNKSSISQSDIEKKLKANFNAFSDSNLNIIAHYLYNNPQKWSSAGDDTKFVEDVNKLLPEAFASDMRPSNAIFGALIAVVVILLVAFIWWMFSSFLKKRNNNILSDPTIVNPTFI